MEKLLLTADEAATVLGLSRRKFYDLLLRAEVESVQIGRSRRIPTEALNAYVEKLRRDNGCDAA